jgi:GT2 family glycosyltransferase
MMIDRESFDAVGGFAGCFVDGEFEDVDLCLRLRRDKGLNSYLACNVQLYHLEGQSRPAKRRALAMGYNTWLLGNRISEQSSGGMK